jgi:hypothetical protein
MGKQPKPPVGIPLAEYSDTKGSLRAAPLPKEPFTMADKVETIQLVPYGFTLLRMTYLPVAPLNP